MKSIEQLLALSKNPHYVLSDDELSQLEAYRRLEDLEKNKQNKNVFNKHDTSFNKHDVTLEVIE